MFQIRSGKKPDDVGVMQACLDGLGPYTTPQALSLFLHPDGQLTFEAAQALLCAYLSADECIFVFLFAFF